MTGHDARSAPTLTDGRVTLRALGPQDVEGCLEQCVDPASVRWTTVPTPYTLADAAGFCLQIAPAAWADGSQWIFAIEAEGRYAGNLALRPVPYARAELAYGAHPAARGTGVMQAACRLVLEWGFAEQGLASVLWMANVGNWASRKLAWRLGFTIDATARRWLPDRGAYVDGWLGTLHHDDPRTPRNRWLDSPVLQGRSGATTIRLRPFAERDIARVVEACRDERTQHWSGLMASPYTESDARAWHEASTLAAAEGTGIRWAGVDPGDDRLLASITASRITEHDCRIGYWTHPDARGRGVMTAALKRVVDWCFTDLGLARTYIGAAEADVASRHVIEAGGFRRAGVQRAATRLRTGWADLVLYDALASEWCAAD